MNKLSVLILSGMFAAAAFAQTGTAAPEAQMQSSPKAQAAAEANHLKKVHGTDASAKQPEAQMQSSPKAQAVAEANHLKKVHGNVNNAADKRLEMDHPNH